MKNFFYLISFVVILTVSCKKDVVIVNNGIYRGVFYKIKTANSDTINEGVCNLAIFDENQTFSLKGDTATGVPKNCNGNYEISDTEMIFENTAAIGEFFYDQFLYLDTIYAYTFSDTASTFDLEFYSPTHSYIYRLRRN